MRDRRPRSSHQPGTARDATASPLAAGAHDRPAADAARTPGRHRSSPRLVPFAAIVLALGAQATAASAQLAQRDRQSLEAIAALEAYAAQKSGDFATARARWEALAARGNTTAMINLANMLAQGQGGPADLVTALAWTRRAAEAGDARAQLDMGLACEAGSGVGRDLARAETWLERAAAQGLAEAQYALGALIASGRGAGPRATTEADRAAARAWLERAAAQGHAGARALLAALPG